MIQLPRVEWRLLACSNGASPDCIIVVVFVVGCCGCGCCLLFVVGCYGKCLVRVYIRNCLRAQDSEH